MIQLIKATGSPVWVNPELITHFDEVSYRHEGEQRMGTDLFFSGNDESPVRLMINAHDLAELLQKEIAKE